MSPRKEPNMEIDVAEWADKWQKVNREYDGSMRDRPKVGIQFAIDLIRAVIADDKTEQPAPAPAGDVIRALQAELADERQQRAIFESELSNLAGFVQEMHTIGEVKVIGLREAVKGAKQVVVKLKAELAEAKKRALPAGWEMSATMVSRQDECERLTKENATLREQLAEATKPVENAKTLFATDANGTTFLAVYEVDFRRERAARIAAERDSKDAGKWLWKFGDAVGCDGGWGSILNEVIALRLRAEAATTKPVDFESARTVELDGMKMIYLGDAQAAVRCERAARSDAERRACKAEGFMRALSQLTFTLCRHWHSDEGHSAANVNECREG